MRWRFLAFLPRFPPSEEVVGGAQIRPDEIFRRCAERGHRVLIYETETSAGTRRVGELEVRPLPSQRRGVLGLGLRMAAMARVLRAEAKRARAAGERLCYYAMIPSGFVLKAGFLPAPTHPGGLLLPLARALGAVTWAAVHDLSPEHEQQLLQRADANARGERRVMERKARLGTAQQRLLLPRAHFLSAVSPAMVDLLQRRCALDPRRLAVFWSGVAPKLVEEIPPWIPPAPGEPWRVGYLGSPHDVSYSLLARSLAALGREDLVLRLGGVDASRHAARARAAYARVEVVDGICYQDYASFAREIDLWALPFDDSYCLEITWQLKVPLALASGRPLARSDGPIVATSDLARYMHLGGSTPKTFAPALQAVLDDPPAAASRARAAREDVLRRYRWDVLIDQLLEGLERASKLV